MCIRDRFNELFCKIDGHDCHGQVILCVDQHDVQFHALAGVKLAGAFLVLFKNIGKGKQLYFSAFLCLK